MLEGLPLRVGMNPIIDLPVIREVQVPQRLDGAECRSLCAEIRSAQVNRLHNVSHSRMNPLEIPEGDLALTFKDLMNIVLAAARGDIPFGDIAYAFRMFEGGSRYQGNVAECGPSKCCNHAVTRCRRLVRRARKVVQIRLRDGPELFQIIFGIQMLFIECFLAHNAIEEVAALRHSSACLYGRIALRIDRK